MKLTILTAASLLSDDGDNPEYDRALIELVCQLTGIDASSEDTRTTVLTLLRAVS